VRFVERKIVHEAVAVAHGQLPAMTLGSLDTRRDWSWAGDIVEALRLMAERERGGDFVLGSGELHSTGDWVDLAFRKLGLDREKHLRLNPKLQHRADTPKTFGDIRPAREALGWHPTVSFESMVERLINAEEADRSSRLATH
jgi:GDPmannose 4,6-dehydratase